MTTGPTPEPLDAFLVGHGLVGPGSRASREPLAGGVSSDIWLVRADGRPFVVKRPLADLKVAGTWQAPLARSDSEAGWLRVAGELLPGVCPRVLAYDPERHLLALEYLDPATHRLWKLDLLAGVVDLTTASAVGERIGTIHRLTSAMPQLAAQFATDDLFRALRMEPYLERLTDRHPDLAAPLAELVTATMGNRHALVHGDVSPKNILQGPRGPVLLDAETAWWGDPAFDLAFCANHLLLKCLLPGAPTDALLAACWAMVRAYLPQVTWEPPERLTARVTRLLPALLLARVDGTSPVEYLDDAAQDVVRAVARSFILTPPTDLVELTTAWKAVLT